MVFDEGNYWCRTCGRKGWVDEEDRRQRDQEALRCLHLEQAQRRARRETEEKHRQLAALEKMLRCRDHLRYHRALNVQARAYWHAEGITDESIEQYLLGYCSRCPTASNGSPSYTIPVINHGRLENIRHRLLQPDGGKYRPHRRGLGIQLFNADFLDDAQHETIIITEGAKKSIVLAQHAFLSVAIMGKRSFRLEWLPRFRPFRQIYVVLDPDAVDAANRLAALFKGRARVVHLPCKPDDMFVRYGATAGDLQAYLKLARPVRGPGQNRF